MIKLDEDSKDTLRRLALIDRLKSRTGLNYFQLFKTIMTASIDQLIELEKSFKAEEFSDALRRLAFEEKEVWMKRLYDVYGNKPKLHMVKE